MFSRGVDFRFIYIMGRKSDDGVKRKESLIYENDPYAPSMMPFAAHGRLQCL